MIFKCVSIDFNHIVSQLNADRKSDWSIFKPEGICTPIYSPRHSRAIKKSVHLGKKVQASSIYSLLCMLYLHLIANFL